SLLLSYGLLNTKNTIIRPDKVQIVTVGRNYFQKKMNILDLKIKQASTSQVDGDTLKNNAIEIPGCNESEKEMLLKFLLEKVPERGVALRPNIRKIIMETLMFVIIPVGVYFAFAYNFPELVEYAFIIPLYLLFAGLLIFMGFRNARLFVNDEFVIKQSGAWDVDRDFIAPHKIQSLSLKQFFWHRSSNIGIVTLHTAGGPISFGLADYSRLKELVNYWLCQVESGNRNWM
ncbi:MAG: hypothetical protein EOO45_25560, partial [Flavobacterium sp.]